MTDLDAIKEALTASNDYREARDNLEKAGFDVYVYQEQHSTALTVMINGGEYFAGRSQDFPWCIYGRGRQWLGESVVTQCFT